MGTLLANHNVFFNYGTEPVQIGHKLKVVNGEKVKEPTIKDKKYAECIISDMDGTVVSKGRVRRYHKDQDVKTEARYQAFRKAVQNIDDKVVRKALRTAFRDTIKLPDNREVEI